MILPPVVRVFFAVEIPANIKAKLAEYIESLKKLSKSHQIRWTRSENLHITLQFVGEVQGKDVDQLIAAVQDELKDLDMHLHLNVGELHLFPDPHRPRVLVLNVSPQADLAKLSAQIGRGVVKVGYEIESRQFRAHLSIGRIKTSQKSALNFLADIDAPHLEAFEINDIVLFQSEPHPEGSQYIPLHRLHIQHQAHEL